LEAAALDIFQELLVVGGEAVFDGLLGVDAAYDVGRNSGGR
jgi:hypothetical protein